MSGRNIGRLGLAVIVTAVSGAIAALVAFGQGAPAHDEHAHHGRQMPPATQPSAQPAPPASAPAEFRGAVSVPVAVQQRIGVTLGEATHTPLRMRVSTVGIVRPDETRLAHVHLKTEGWVTKLHVDFTGQKVRAGEPLLTIYSPAFFTAQREFLSALAVAKASPSPDQQIVLDAARRRLELWDVPKEEIESLESSGNAAAELTLRSPIGGTVLEKKVFAGMYVTPQDELYLVADLSAVWVQAKVYEYELPHIEVGMPATVTLPALPQRRLEGKVAFIDPTVDEATRTVQVRIELPNEQGELRPGMFANAVIEHEMGHGLTVPETAVIRTGERAVAFVAAGTGRFVPVEIVVSPISFEGRLHVLSGLDHGQTVVTSANFLIDSESRLRGEPTGAGEQAPSPQMHHHH
jgi:Cu(I)/Ag(I) efflux system membrane fusion protein